MEESEKINKRKRGNYSTLSSNVHRNTEFYRKQNLIKKKKVNLENSPSKKSSYLNDGIFLKKLAF